MFRVKVSHLEKQERYKAGKNTRRGEKQWKSSRPFVGALYSASCCSFCPSMPLKVLFL
jgi:hypothetical protein